MQCSHHYEIVFKSGIPIVDKKKKLIVRKGEKKRDVWARLVNSGTMVEIYRVVICKADRMYPAGGESGSQGVISGTKAGAVTSGTKLVEN